MNPKRKATLADIAREAKVSKQTVSRVINNHPDVSHQTRKEIQEIIDRLGYQPNALARGLSARRSRSIGVVIARLDQFGPSTMLMEIDREGHEAGYRVVPYIVHEDDMSDPDLHLRNLMSLQPDGIVWAMTKEEASPEFFEQQALLHDVPIVTTNRDIVDVPSVLVIDEVEASKILIQHLLEQDYRQIGIITGPLNWRISHKRLDGWRTALMEAGCSAEERQIVEGNWTASSGQKGMSQLLAQYPEIDAVFASNDQMALGALNLLQSRGIRIPQDCGVVGYDDIPEASFFMPSLTTLHQPFAEYGRIIIQSLLQMIEQAQEGKAVSQPETKIIRPSLVVRQSSLRGRTSV